MQETCGHENSLFLLVCISVQSLSRVRLFATPWTTACQASLSITNSQNLPKLMSIESVMPSNHLILCRPLLLLPSIFFFFWLPDRGQRGSAQVKVEKPCRQRHNTALSVSAAANRKRNPALNLSSIRVFANESALCIRWPKYWSFSFNISSSTEHPGLISFRMDWL